MMTIALISTSPQFWGYAFLITGVILKYLIGKRRFNRRGLGGLQQYYSYEWAFVTTIIEWVFKWVAVALILLGAFLLIKW